MGTDRGLSETKENEEKVIQDVPEKSQTLGKLR